MQMQNTFFYQPDLNFPIDMLLKGMNFKHKLQWKYPESFSGQLQVCKVVQYYSELNKYTSL